MSHEDAAVMCDGPLTSLNFLRAVAELRAGQKVLILCASGSLGSAAVQIVEMVEDGKLVPLIDRVFPLGDLIEAHRPMETVRKRGNVVVV